MQNLAVAARRQDRLMTVVETDHEKRILIAAANLDDLSDALCSAHDAPVDADPPVSMPEQPANSSTPAARRCVRMLSLP
jgi:hypothetical protein